MACPAAFATAHLARRKGVSLPLGLQSRLWKNIVSFVRLIHSIACTLNLPVRVILNSLNCAQLGIQAPTRLEMLFRNALRTESKNSSHKILRRLQICLTRCGWRGKSVFKRQNKLLRHPNCEIFHCTFKCANFPFRFNP
ncbi:hypothetical protein DQ04_06631030 [Trypanosoma grayi]|uniref:hypothetical protein n=1 Tax=Trypanosoma grayi TaxID=71804 RepID=UPI0004F4715D|nr:hypothetical protein DQ04_06631030 [Trypanosoma grayi]KEG08692.1 hypothetical protein DQ04_06631030 [Trypanosoma grayi]